MLASCFQLLAARLPARCEICHAWPARPVCGHCTRKLVVAVPRCRRCALHVPAGVAECGACLREPPALDACHAAVSYGWPWAGLIARFKFQGEPGSAATLAGLMRGIPGLSSALEAADLVLPMPLAPARLAERGFNQALELARRLAPRKTDGRLLLRVRETLPQLALDRAARLRNVQDAFALEPLRAGRVQQAAIALVDDVMTSGASLQAAARVLRQAGARSVTAVVLARTENF